MKKFIVLAALAISNFGISAAQIEQYTTFISEDNKIILSGKIHTGNTLVPIARELSTCLQEKTRIKGLCETFESRISPVEWKTGENRANLINQVMVCLSSDGTSSSCKILNERF
jgi:hypothetical protein